jgi:hypothetical protein
MDADKRRGRRKVRADADKRRGRRKVRADADDEPRPNVEPDGEPKSTFLGAIYRPIIPGEPAPEGHTWWDNRLRQLEEAEQAQAEKKTEEDELRKLDLAAARRREKRPTPREPGRPTGAVAVDEETFFRLLQLAVGGASARAMEKATTEEPELSFVNRHKAGDLKGWVEDHLRAAQTALAGREIPRSFSTTDDGVIIPKRSRKA